MVAQGSTNQKSRKPLSLKWNRPKLHDSHLTKLDAATEQTVRIAKRKKTGWGEEKFIKEILLIKDLLGVFFLLLLS